MGYHGYSLHTHSLMCTNTQRKTTWKGTYVQFLSAKYIHSYAHTHTHTHSFPPTQDYAHFTSTCAQCVLIGHWNNFLHKDTHKYSHTHTHTQCFDPREQASCVCAGAVTSALIINQWANCKRTQSASLAHMTSPMHVSIHRVYKPFKVSGPLQYSWLIITDGRHTLCNTLHWYRTMIRTQTERSGGLGRGIINW